MDVQKVGFHEKGHISANMRPTDLRQVSKFSFDSQLKLFPWNRKDLVGRKNSLREPKIFSFISLGTFFAWVKTNGCYRKWHNSEIISPRDLRQVSKFSFGRYLKLFLWHPKDLASRKNVLGAFYKVVHYFCRHCN